MGKAQRQSKPYMETENRRSTVAGQRKAWFRRLLAAVVCLQQQESNPCSLRIRTIRKPMIIRRGFRSLEGLEPASQTGKLKSKPIILHNIQAANSSLRMFCASVCPSFELLAVRKKTCGLQITRALEGALQTRVQQLVNPGLASS